MSDIYAIVSDNLVYHYLLEKGCSETAKLLVKEKGTHTNQIKWFEDIVNGIALVDFEKMDNNEAVLKLPTNDGCTVNIKATNLIGSAKVCEGSEDSTIILNVDSFTKAEKISSMPVVISYKEKFRVSSSSNDGLGKYFIGDHKSTHSPQPSQI